MRKLYTNIPNIISVLRILASPFLFYLLCTHQERVFVWLLIACLVSDIVDGLIARYFQLQSELGARLDSIGDLLTSIFAFLGVAMFQTAFLISHVLPLIILVSLYFLIVLLALQKYGQISSFHTYFTRVAAYAQGIFFITLFLFGPNEIIFYLMFALTFAAYLEEVILVFKLDAWQTDVRGLLWLNK